MNWHFETILFANPARVNGVKVEWELSRNDVAFSVKLEFIFFLEKVTKSMN